MQDITEAARNVRVLARGRDSSRDNMRSGAGDPASDALGVPLLSDNPAPLSEALHIPTLIGATTNPATGDAHERRNREMGSTAAERGRGNGVVAKDEPPSSNGKIVEFDQFGRRRSSDTAALSSSRATTPAGPPREDAGSFFGLPTNHQQTAISDRLMKLDKVAMALGALMTIGPLFAAMVSRSMS